MRIMCHYVYAMSYENIVTLLCIIIYETFRKYTYNRFVRARQFFTSSVTLSRLGFWINQFQSSNLSINERQERNWKIMCQFEHLSRATYRLKTIAIITSTQYII